MVYAIPRPRIAHPPTITEVQSFSFVIRDAFLDRLKRTPFFSSFFTRKSKQLQIMPNQIPYLGVYFINEDMSPDGDLNAGEIRFTHMLKLGFSVAIVNNDPVACEAKLDEAFWIIMNTLWRDPNLTNMLNTTAYTGVASTPDNVRIEGVSRGTRRHVFGNAGLDNELPYGEMQYEATIKYEADYAPIITDQLLQVGLRTGVKPGDTEEEMAARQQMGLEIEFERYPPPEVQPLDEKE